MTLRGEFLSKSWIYLFDIKINDNNKFNIEDIEILKNNIEDALYKLDLDIISNDPLNKLIVICNIPARKVQIIRAIIKYLHQTNLTYGIEYIQEILINIV